MCRLYVWEFAYKHEQLWSYTNKALPSNVKKDSMAIVLDDDGAHETRPGNAKNEDPQALALLAISRYMENSMTSIDPTLLKKKHALEVDALELAKEKQALEVQMLKKSNDTVDLDNLLKIISNPGMSDGLKARAEAQLAEFYMKKKPGNVDGESAGAGSGQGHKSVRSNAWVFIN